ncbi:hypothetical protein [Sporosarcina sp. ANT_H38]|uniref:hypothetical protein n=1 Tax=Sporosarcina sp. ANT_H38 TaxID=2597358 RepID=UPI00165E5148|nr:hypothetical protein [Sporosarcina sp. ANT_H38]
MTAVYITRDVQGDVEMDETESIDVQYLSIEDQPDGLILTFQSYMDLYMSRLGARE